MTTNTPPSVVDRRTKIDLGILVSLMAIGAGLLGGGVAAIFYFGALKSDVAAVTKGLAKVEIAINRNTDQLQSDSKELAVLSQIVHSQGVTIIAIQKRLSKLEDNPR